MGEALYRKYRPQSLNDVVGQPHVTQTLDNAVAQKRLSHGYLFSGPRGVGKTSIARILAHQVNGFPYGDPRGSLDIIEIDAASNRRIDEIRELRDKVNLAPVSGKYKVYIIDEVHMLTREAFNALLKTLEEPPKHVIFILATTEAHKLPETIISRTQHFAFKAVPKSAVSKHLASLARQENISISDDALNLIAEHGGGSFRDSISILDQLSSNADITEDIVLRSLGIPPLDTSMSILEATDAGDTQSLVTQLDTAVNEGFAPSQIASQLSKLVRQSVIDGAPQFGNETISFLESLMLTASSSDPKQYLELILLDKSLSKTPAPRQAVVKATPAPKSEQPKPAKVSTKQVTAKPADQPQEKIKPTPSKSASKVDAASLQDLLSDDLWQKVLDVLKKRYNTLYGVARMAEPRAEDGILVLVLPFAFHQKRLSEEKNTKVISDILTEVSGKAIQFKTEIKSKDQDQTKSTTENSEPAKPDSATLQAVTDIFGGGEVLEQ